MSVKARVSSTDVDNPVEERELVQFEQSDVFLRILLSDDFYPGGLAQNGPTQLPTPVKNDDEGRQRLAKGEESMRKLTSIVSVSFDTSMWLLEAYHRCLIS